MWRYWPTCTSRIHMLSFLSQIWYRSIYLVADGRYLHDVLKEFGHQNKLDERAEHVLRAAEVKYCFECGESREFKCCHGCYQIWCGDSAKVTQCQGGDESRAVQGSKRWIERVSGKHIVRMSNVAYTNDQGCCVPHSQAPVFVGDCAVCNVDENILLAA